MRPAAFLVTLLLLLGGCGTGSHERPADLHTITALMVGNPQMLDIEKLTAKYFTATTGIKVRFTVLPENDLRVRLDADVAQNKHTYDLVTAGAYEVPIWAKQGLLRELSTQVAADPAYDVKDLLKPVVDSLTGDDGLLYGLPFYGESSVLMYNKRLLAAKGLTVPEHPTWAQVAALAAKLTDRAHGVSGICLRGEPGWGELGAPLTTVVNTYGGTWFDKDWAPQVDAPGFTAATNFYVGLVRRYGEPDAAHSGYTECLTTFSQGKAALWYDATAASGPLEDPATSSVAGQVGYVYAPVVRTQYAGWLWNWSWVLPKTGSHAGDAWKFAAWATGKDYENLVGAQLGWERVPAGKRSSTYAIPRYAASSTAFSQVTLGSIEHANPRSPGLQPRPAIGVQFVGIPEFAKLGTDVTTGVSAAIAGTSTVGKALATGQAEAANVAKLYQ